MGVSIYDVRAALLGDLDRVRGEMSVVRADLGDLRDRELRLTRDLNEKEKRISKLRADPMLSRASAKTELKALAGFLIGSSLLSLAYSILTGQEQQAWQALVGVGIVAAITALMAGYPLWRLRRTERELLKLEEEASRLGGELKRISSSVADLEMRERSLNELASFLQALLSAVEAEIRGDAQKSLAAYGDAP